MIRTTGLRQAAGRLGRLEQGPSDAAGIAIAAVMQARAKTMETSQTTHKVRTGAPIIVMLIRTSGLRQAAAAGSENVSIWRRRSRL